MIIFLVGIYSAFAVLGTSGLGVGGGFTVFSISPEADIA